MNDASSEAGDWPEALFALIKAHGVTQVAYVPDAGHARLISLCEADPDLHAVLLTTEEEGIGLMLGAWLGGARGVLLMQSSGVGNCINMISLGIMHRTPMPMIVTMRGDFGEFNPAQVPMGSATQPVLEAMGVAVRRADTVEDVAPTADAMLRLAFNTYRPTATLIGQRVVGAKTFVNE